MRAMVLEQIGAPLRLREMPKPTPQGNQLLLRVEACGVCRTDLHIAEGDLAPPHLPLILGHQIVGVIEARGPSVRSSWEIGARVGAAWLAGSCGHCHFCSSGHENLCETGQFTGYTVAGGFAEYTLADADFVFSLPSAPPAPSLAPLLCAGMVGYRAYNRIREATHLGFYGFGSSAHILIQLAIHEGKQVAVFTRPGSLEHQNLARKLGAHWVGGSDCSPPFPLEGAIVFAPDGALIPKALGDVRPGGAVVCAGIHMSAIPSFPYSLLWGERSLMSIANLTRSDGQEFLPLALAIPVATTVQTYPLEEANAALHAIKSGTLYGSAVLS